MNRQISHLFVLVLVLFGAADVVYTSRWTVFEAKGLQDESANRRPLLEEQRIPRGYIYADDGTVLARDVREGHGRLLRYVRTYPQNGAVRARGRLLLHHARRRRARARGERQPRRQRHNEFTSLIDEITNTKKVGDDLRTTLDPAGAAHGDRRSGRARRQRRGDRAGHRAGARAGLSVPGYNPNNIPSHWQLNRDRAAAVRPRDAGPLPAGLDDEGASPRRRRSTAGATRPTRSCPASRRRSSVACRSATVHGGQRQLRTTHAHGGAGQVREHGVGRGRREARQRPHVQVHGPVRLQQEPADRAAPTGDQLPAASTASADCSARTTPSTSGAWRSARSGFRSRRSRWRWSPPRLPTAAS